MSIAFSFTGVDGLEYSLPKQIPTAALRATRRMDNLLDAGFTMIEMTASPEVLEAFDQLPAPEGLKVMREWMQGAQAPNSSSSPTSSPESTASPSSATSANGSDSQ